MPPSSVKCAVKHQGAGEMFALLNTSVMEGRKEEDATLLSYINI